MRGPSRQCQVCNQAQSKYKCPSCLVPYCSLTCFKTHKETPCVKLGSTNDAETTTVKPGSSSNPKKESFNQEFTEQKSSASPRFQLERKLEVDDPSEVLPILQLQSIASSSEVCDSLKDEHLRKIISEIDSSPEAMNELDKAMGVDVFRIFSDKILSTINP